MADPVTPDPNTASPTAGAPAGDSAVSQPAVDGNTGSAPAVAPDAAEGASAASGEGVKDGGTAAPAPAETSNAHAEPTLLEGAKAPGAEESEAKPDAAAKPEGAKPEDAKPAEADAAKPDAEPKKDEAKAEDAGKPDTEAKSEPVKPEPVEYKYELPETLQLSDERRTEMHTALDNFRADPTNVQPLIDLHNKAMTEFAEHTSREQHRIFGETRANWRKDIMADPVLGGAGHQTALQAAARGRDLLVSQHRPGTPEYEKDWAAFNDMLRVTGAGDHPAMMRLLHNAAQIWDEPTAPPSEINPPKDIGRDPARGARVLYDHPRSNPQGRG